MNLLVFYVIVSILITVSELIFLSQTLESNLDPNYNDKIKLKIHYINKYEK